MEDTHNINFPIFEQNNLIIGGENATIKAYKFNPAMYNNLEFKIHQANGICYPEGDDQNIVVFIDNHDHYGLPGGRIEKGETPEQALVREVKEEVNCEVLEYTPIAYTVWHFLKSNEKNVMIWYKCKVKLGSDELNDPDGESKTRLLLKDTDFEIKFKSGGHFQAVLELIAK